MLNLRTVNISSKKLRAIACLGISLIILGILVLFVLFSLLSFAENSRFRSINDRDLEGGCTPVDGRQQEIAESIGNFHIPEIAEDVQIFSEISLDGNCYILVQFSMSEFNLSIFLSSISISNLSVTIPSEHFWHGAAFTNWPLIQGNVYLSGKGNFRDIVYHDNIVYFVLSVSL